MAVIDDHAVADRAFRGDQQVYLLARFHRDQVVVDEALELGGRHAAPRDAVFIEVYDVTPSREDAALLVAVGQEEVFAMQSPVEECPVHGLVHHAQVTRLPGAEQRRFGSRHEAVFRIVVDENLLFVAGFVGEGDITVGQQNLVLLLVGEV